MNTNKKYMNWFSKFRGKETSEAPKEVKETQGEEKGAEAQAEEKDAKQEKLANFEQRVDAAEAKVVREKAVVDSFRKEMETIGARLDEFDPEWRQGEDGFSRDSGQDMDPGVASFKKLYKEKADAFSTALEGLNKSQAEYAAASNHLRALEEFGIDLTERSGDIEGQMNDLRAQLERADAVMTDTSELRPRLDQYISLSAEMEAIGEGEWDNKEDWLPESAEVPSFMPNFIKNDAENPREGTYTPDRQKSEEIEGQIGEREKMGDLNEQMGVDRDAF